MAHINIRGRMNIQGRASVRRSSVTLWSPAVLDPLLWLDSTQLDTLTVEDGRVTEWRDAMGSWRRVIPRNTDSRPAYNGTINGINVPTFNGNGYSLQTGTTNADGDAWRALPFQTEMITFGIIDWYGGREGDMRTFWQPTNNNIPYTPTLRIDTGTPPKRLNTLIGGVDSDNNGNSSAISGVNTGFNTIDVGVHIVGIWAKDNIHYIHCDGEEWNATDHSTTSLGAPGTIRIGGGTFTPDRDFEGGFGEFIHLRANVSIENVQRIEGYFAHKWGHTSLLSVSHPYKYLAPLA
jgi:hypothetical protein